VVKQLLNDDEAVLELLECAEEKKGPESATTARARYQASLALQPLAQQSTLYDSLGSREAEMSRARQLAGLQGAASPGQALAQPFGYAEAIILSYL